MHRNLSDRQLQINSSRQLLRALARPSGLLYPIEDTKARDKQASRPNIAVTVWKKVDYNCVELVSALRYDP